MSDSSRGPRADSGHQGQIMWAGIAFAILCSVAGGFLSSVFWGNFRTGAGLGAAVGAVLAGVAGSLARKALKWAEHSGQEPHAKDRIAPAKDCTQPVGSRNTSSEGQELAPQPQDRSSRDGVVAVASDHPSHADRDCSSEATSTETKSPIYRKRWFLYGSSCLFVVLFAPVFLGMLMFVLGAMGIIPQASRALQSAGEALVMLTFALALVTFGYRLLDKHLIHRGQPGRRTSRVYSAMKIAVSATLVLAITCMLLALLVPAIESQRAHESATTDSPQAIRFISRDGRYLIEAPSGWQESSQSPAPGAVIDASDLARNLHLTVYAVSKSDLVEPDLRAFAASRIAQISQFCENPETTPWNAVNINGLPALQCEARGEINNMRSMRSALLVTCVDTGGRFCVIVAETTRSGFEENRAELEAITSTFRQVEEQPTDDSRPVRFTSRDGRYVIEAPSGWQESPQQLKNDALICVSDLGRDLHISVNAVNKSDFVDADLQDYATTCVAQLSQSLENPETSPWNAIIINDARALQCEVHGEIYNMRGSYLLTCVDTADRFCLVLAFTTRSLFRENLRELEAITNTFRWVDSGSQ